MTSEDRIAEMKRIFDKLESLEQRLVSLEKLVGELVNAKTAVAVSTSTAAVPVDATAPADAAGPIATNIPVDVTSTATSAENETVASGNSVEQNDPSVIIGTFDGECIVTPQGTRIEVSESFAAKSKVVYGDTVRLKYENDDVKFRLLEKKPRAEVRGILTKHNDSFYIVTETHSYKTLTSAVEHFGASEHDDVVGLVPADNREVPFAAFAKLYAEESGGSVEVSGTSEPSGASTDAFDEELR